jgi:hypothetical protein
VWWITHRREDVAAAEHQGHEPEAKKGQPQ